MHSFLAQINSYTISQGLYVVQPNDTWTSITTLVNNTNSTINGFNAIAVGTLQSINSVFSDTNANANSSLVIGGLIHVPIGVMVVGMTPILLPTLSGNYTYVYDPSTTGLYTVGASLNGSNVGQLIMDTTGLSVPVSLISDIYATTGSLTLDLIDGLGTTGITLNNANTAVTLVNGGTLNSDLTFNADSALVKIGNTGTSTEFDFGQNVGGFPISVLSTPLTGVYTFGLDDPFESVVSFAPDGLNGDTEGVTVADGVAVFDTQIGNGATAEVGSSYDVGSTQTDFTFTSNSGILALDDPWSFDGTIYGAVTGDIVEFVGVTGAAITQFASQTDPTFKFESGTGQTATIAFAPPPVENYSTAGFEVGNITGNGDLSIEIIRTTVCFCAGSLIKTPAGEVPVEDLSVGDVVLTSRCDARPILWIGIGRVLTKRGRRNAATPVIVRKGALADNVPHRDLHVTKAHSLYLDGVLIPVEFLVNHRSILWNDHAQEVTLYHIELETHDILLANGAPAESYRDDGNRWLFQNANTGWDLSPKPPCAPVLTGGPLVDTIWRRLLDRAGPRKGPPLTDDPDLHLLVDGWRVDAASRSNVWYVFQLAARPTAVRIISRACAPQELGLARDPRSLGVALRQIMVREGLRVRTIEARDELLTEGYHSFEAEEGIRWTDGDAVVPASLFDGFPRTLEILLRLGGSTTYVDDGTMQQVA